MKNVLMLCLRPLSREVMALWFQHTDDQSRVQYYSAI